MGQPVPPQNEISAPAASWQTPVGLGITALALTAAIHLCNRPNMSAPTCAELTPYDNRAILHCVLACEMSSSQAARPAVKATLFFTPWGVWVIG